MNTFKVILCLQFRKHGSYALNGSYTLYNVMQMPFPPFKDLIITGNYVFKVDQINWFSEEHGGNYFMVREGIENAITFDETWDTRIEWFLQNGWSEAKNIKELN